MTEEVEHIKISIIIKALNEGDGIEKCIQSLIYEVSDFKSEIILVDSISTDNTIDFAKKYPIRIVQFSNKEDVCCGAAPQLGYQYASGEYIFIIDGDMEVCPGFLYKALDYLEAHPSIAGVGGKLIDTQVCSDEDQRRVDSYSKINGTKNVSHLGGGGLYRGKAIESVNYISHRGLKAFEEAELGMRLISKGFGLVRINENSVLHTGHTESGFCRLIRLWKNGRLKSHGLFLKSAWRHNWWWMSARHLWYVFAPLAVDISFCAMLIGLSCFFDHTAVEMGGMFVACWLGIFLLISMKRKSFRAGFFSILTWHLALLASILSLKEGIVEPEKPISSIEIQ